MKKTNGRTDHAVKTLSKIHQFHIKEAHWDVQLQIDSRIFKCHRVLLAATCKYFDSMFCTSDFEESNATKHQPVILNEIDATAFEDILHFIYTGKIRVNDTNLLQLLYLNDHLRLQSGSVKKECFEFLVGRSVEPIPMSNAFDLLRFACSKKGILFVDTVCGHIFEHPYHFSKDTRLMGISFENLKALLELAKKYILPLPGSSNVLLAIILNWVNYNRKERKKYRRKLVLESIDSSKVSPDFKSLLYTILQNAIDEEDVQSIPELNTLLDIGDVGDNARLSATIPLELENISELKRGQAVFSTTCIISNLSWKTYVEWEDDELNFYLKCGGTGTTTEWACYASIIFTIKSPKEGSEVFRSETCHFPFSLYQTTYCKSTDYFSRNPMDPEEGHTEDDDSISLVAHVNADVPFRIEMGYIEDDSVTGVTHVNPDVPIFV